MHDDLLLLLAKLVSVGAVVGSTSKHLSFIIPLYGLRELPCHHKIHLFCRPLKTVVMTKARNDTSWPPLLHEFVLAFNLLRLFYKFYGSFLGEKLFLYFLELSLL